MKAATPALLKYLLYFFLFTITEKGVAAITCAFNITGNDTSCAPLLLQASAVEVSSSTVVERIWELSGPIPTYTTTPGGNNPLFYYLGSKPGNYCLKLTSKNANGEVSTIQKCNIYIAANPVLNMSLTSVSGCAPILASATYFRCDTSAGSGVINSFQLDWGCGPVYTSSTCPPVPLTKLYSSCPPGYYNPTVVVYNSFGCHTETTFTHAVHITPKPHAYFSANVTTSNCASGPLNVNFTADPAGQTCVTYNWYVNNVLKYSDTTGGFQYVFPISVNCYDIKLVVRNCDGCSDSVERLDYVCVRSTPQILYTVNDSSVCITAGTPFNFILTNVSVAPPNLTWHLTGPYDSTQFGPLASFPLSTPGNYSVEITGTFGPGCSSTINKLNVIVVKQKPVVDFRTHHMVGGGDEEDTEDTEEEVIDIEEVVEEDLNIDEITDLYKTADIESKKDILETSKLISEAIHDKSWVKETIKNEYDDSMDTFGYDAKIEDICSKYYVYNQYIFKDDSIKTMRNKITLSIPISNKFGKNIKLLPETQYFWSEYFYDNKILNSTSYELNNDTLGIYNREQLNLYFNYGVVAGIILDEVNNQLTSTITDLCHCHI